MGRARFHTGSADSCLKCLSDRSPTLQELAVGVVANRNAPECGRERCLLEYVRTDPPTRPSVVLLALPRRQRADRSAS